MPSVFSQKVIGLSVAVTARRYIRAGEADTLPWFMVSPDTRAGSPLLLNYTVYFLLDEIIYGEILFTEKSDPTV